MAFKETCRCLVMMSPIDTRNLKIIILRRFQARRSNSLIIFVLKVHLIKLSLFGMLSQQILIKDSLLVNPSY